MVTAAMDMSTTVIATRSARRSPSPKLVGSAAAMREAYRNTVPW